MSVKEDTIKSAKQKEKELIRLLQVKAEKLANNYLTEQKHTQLSYLPRDDQEFNVALPKGILLDKMIAYLKSI